MLQGVVQGGTGTGAVSGISRPVAGKTGTTQDHADGWFIGYTHQQVSTAVWVGDIRGRIPIEGRGSISGSLFGGNAPASIWNRFMVRATEGMPVTHFPAAPPLPSAEVPDVVGLQEAEAIDVLGEANFTAEVHEGPSTQPAGSVFRQSPGGGASVTAGSVVTIFVANGNTPKRAVPNVVGDSSETARFKLESAEFQVEVSYVDVDEPNEDNIVRDQEPQGGAKAPVGSSVRIVVGHYVQPSPSPSPSESCDPDATPKCDKGPPNNGTNGTGGTTGAATTAAFILLPLLLAGRARRRALRPGRDRPETT
jgi:membrane peptidoglycan carboxypeptidase